MKRVITMIWTMALAGAALAQDPQPKRPENFTPFRDTMTIEELRTNLSEKTMAEAEAARKGMEQVNAAGKYKPTWESLDAHPVPEWFLDAKFGMFVDWGLYSIPAYAPWGYPDWYLHRMMGDTKSYHDKVWGSDFRQDDFIPLFTARDFDAEYLTDVARATGMKYVVPFLKHHDGFCLWDSSFTMRNSVVMGPKRDLAREWADACKKRNLKFGFYYSIDDWFYPVIGTNNQVVVRTWYCKPEITQWTNNPSDWDRRMMSGKIPVRDFYQEYINPAAIEFFNKYDPDLFWGDGDWVWSWQVRKTLPMLGIDSLTNYQWCHYMTPAGDYDRWGTKAVSRWESWAKEFSVPYNPHVSIGWDTNPRFNKFKGITIFNRSPELFAKYLRLAREHVDKHNLKPRLITINSWNEWSEGSYLEPDERFGMKYLEAVKQVFGVDGKGSNP